MSQLCQQLTVGLAQSIFGHAAIDDLLLQRLPAVAIVRDHPGVRPENGVPDPDHRGGGAVHRSLIVERDNVSKWKVHPNHSQSEFVWCVPVEVTPGTRPLKERHKALPKRTRIRILVTHKSTSDAFNVILKHYSR